jgi:glycosyltransferase involved in cell wall biosynthesis
MDSLEPLSTFPLVSVVIEGYNQARDLGAADNTIAAIAAQDYPLDRIEIVLVGTPEQAEDWHKRYGGGNSPFHRVETVSFSELSYYGFKNSGAQKASGDIIALTDSDVLPRKHWVSAIVENITSGADASMGPTLFGTSDKYDPDSIFMRMAAVVTWGWVLGKRDKASGLPKSRGFVDHNFAMRGTLPSEFQYRTDLGRIVASPLLFRRIVNAGKSVKVAPKQQAVHYFTWKYWLIGLEYRYGHEVYRLRRLDPDYPNQWIRKTWIFEPLVTYFWHVLLDMPKWFRYNRVISSGPIYTVAWFPLFIGFSAFAHLFEMAGGYATMINPDKVRHWAENL